MSSELKVFKEQEVLGKDFKIYGDADNPLFLARDIANWIEHNKPGEMIKNVDDEEKIKVRIDHGDSIAKVLQPNTDYWFLTEDGLYEVLMQSRKLIAKEFKKKVKEILKDVRKHGAHMNEQTLEKALTNPDFLIQLATNLKEEQEKRKQAEAELALKQETITLQEEVIIEQKPKADYVDNFVDSEGLQNMGQVANTFGYGRNTFMKLLRDEKILMAGNKPYQRYMDLEWFEVKTVANGNFINSVTFATSKGVYGLAKKLDLIGK